MQNIGIGLAIFVACVGIGLVLTPSILERGQRGQHYEIGEYPRQFPQLLDLVGYVLFGLSVALAVLLVMWW